MEHAILDYIELKTLVFLYQPCRAEINLIIRGFVRIETVIPFT